VIVGTEVVVKRESSLRIVGIHDLAEVLLADVANALRFHSAVFRPSQSGEEQAGQNGDDGHDNEQFDQRKSATAGDLFFSASWLEHKSHSFSGLLHSPVFGVKSQLVIGSNFVRAIRGPACHQASATPVDGRRYPHATGRRPRREK
jgi:hypothetical protein